MGMYDCLNGEQVKCFYKPIFSKEENQGVLWHSGGNSIYYGDNASLPIKTLYYNYSKNFLIYDEDCKLVHIVKDGKLHKTDKLYYLTDREFNFFKKVINTYGDELKIESLTDFSRYNEEKINMKKDIDQLYKKINPTSDVILQLFKFEKGQNCDIDFLLSILNKSEAQELIDNINKLSIAKSFSNPIELELLKKEVPRDILVDSLKNITSEVLKRLSNKDAEERKVYGEYRKNILLNFKSKWVCENFSKEKLLGEYIYCINFLSYYQDDDNSSLHNKEKYLLCKEELIKFIDENPGLVNKYIDWIKPDESKMFIIDDVLKRIYI